MSRPAGRKAADWVPIPTRIDGLVPCQTCLGDGLIGFDRCPDCFGAAFVPEEGEDGEDGG